MTIRKKIMLSNIITIALVVTFMIIFMFSVFRIYTENYLTPSPADIYDSEAKQYSLSELKIVIDDIKTELYDCNGQIKECENYEKLLKFLETSDTTLALFEKNALYYISNSEDKDDALNLAAVYVGSNSEGNTSAIYSNKDAMVIRTTVDVKNGRSVTMFLINENMSFQTDNENNNAFSFFPNLESSRARKTVFLIALVGIVVVALFSTVMILFVSRSIINPLNKLKEGTKNISEGDLETDVELSVYDDAEIREVVDSFNSMRRRLKESDEQKTKYEQSRKELIAGISHDLKTPITSIKGYVSGLMDGVADTPEKQTRYLSTILNTADDMDGLVDELFLLSKLDVDKIPFEFESTDIGSYLADCSEEMKFAFEQDKLVVSFSDRLEEPAFVNLDRNEFGRVLINIARNSVKYKTDVIGNLHIDLSRPEDKEGYVRIILKDDGAGVAREELDKIFDSFYRTDKSRSNPGSGSGLGLAIAKQIVLRHGGTIGADSEPGSGLAVIIDLPIKGDAE